VHGSDSESCPMANFDISGVGLPDFVSTAAIVFKIVTF
jgi:hypothetical protein